MSTTDRSNTELIDRWRAGDQDAATELYRRYIERVLRLVQRNIAEKYKPRFSPEDIAQSAFRSVFRRTRDEVFEFGHDEDFWKWLVTIVLCKVRLRVRHENAAKRSLTREVRPSPDSPEPFVMECLGRRPNELEATMFADLLQDVIESLNDRQRLWLEQRLSGAQQKEIAAELQMSPRSMQRLANRVRRMFDEYFSDGD